MDGMLEKNKNINVNTLNYYLPYLNAWQSALLQRRIFQDGLYNEVIFICITIEKLNFFQKKILGI